MRVNELLAGNWLEYSGGSRPNGRHIRFWKAPDNVVWLEVHYVFDWNTGETQTFSFSLNQQEFDGLVEGLLTRGHAALDKEGHNQSLHFEWKQIRHGFGFRIRGSNVSALDNPAQIYMRDFHDVNCGPLTVA